MSARGNIRYPGEYIHQVVTDSVTKRLVLTYTRTHIYIYLHVYIYIYILCKNINIGVKVRVGVEERKNRILRYNYQEGDVRLGDFQR